MNSQAISLHCVLQWKIQTQLINKCKISHKLELKYAADWLQQCTKIIPFIAGRKWPQISISTIESKPSVVHSGAGILGSVVMERRVWSERGTVTWRFTVQRVTAWQAVTSITVCHTQLSHVDSADEHRIHQTTLNNTTTNTHQTTGRDVSLWTDLHLLEATSSEPFKCRQANYTHIFHVINLQLRSSGVYCCRPDCLELAARLSPWSVA